jgi:selenide,water dikinase
MGVISTSIKGEMADEATIKEAAFQMSFLNKYASEVAVRVGVNAMTDVTGFGLIGHLNEMCGKQTSIELEYSKIPIIKAAYDLAEYGLFPAGAYRNEDYYEQFCQIDLELVNSHKMLLYDPQTSGGLLLSVTAARAEQLLRELIDAGIEQSVIIGNVIPKEAYNIKLRS